MSQGDVALCLLVNRRARTVRVIDFRSGPSLFKREIVRRVAAEEGLERAFTVVEREEANSWLRLGFHKEGSIPGFYKRTDAQVLGMTISHGSVQAPRPKRLSLAALTTPTAPQDRTVQDRTVQDRTVQDRTVQDPKDDAERAYQAARRLVRARGAEVLPSVRVQPARAAEVVRGVASAVRSGRALTELEPFGRGGERTNYLATARGGFSQLISVESQSCFDNAFVELLAAPRSDTEAWLVAAALREVAELLEAREIRSVFATSPADSVETTAALVAAGFRRTGRMPGHLLVRGERHDAFLWSRRRVDPAWEH